MAHLKVSRLQETKKSDPPEFYQQLQKREQQQAKAIERAREYLNEIGYLANSLMWVGDKLKEQGNGVDEGVLLRHVSLALANLADDVVGTLPRSEEPAGGVA